MGAVAMGDVAMGAVEGCGDKGISPFAASCVTLVGSLVVAMLLGPAFTAGRKAVEGRVGDDAAANDVAAATSVVSV